MILPALSSYLTWLAMTLGIELPIAWFLSARAQRGAVTMTLLHANLVTHPLAMLLATGAGDHLPFLLLEGGVLLAEAAALVAVAQVHWLRGLAIAALANAATTALSVWLGAG